MKSSARKVELASASDLFSTEQERQDAKLERVQNIPLAEPYLFPDYPFPMSGTSIHNGSPANPHEIKVFGQQANTFY